MKYRFLYLIFGVLFNPIAPLYLSKGVWIIIDMTLGCLPFLLYKELSQIENKSLDKRIPPLS